MAFFPSLAREIIALCTVEIGDVYVIVSPEIILAYPPIHLSASCACTTMAGSNSISAIVSTGIHSKACRYVFM
jgi:hypothetical protein